MKPTENLKPIDTAIVSAFELENPNEKGGYHIFDIGHNEQYISVGSITNLGLAVDFWIEKDDCFTLDEQLQAVYELIQDSLYNNEELTGLIEF